MKRRHLLLFLVSVIFFFSCRRDNTTPQGLIVGKWNLQQQHIVMYANQVKITDTVLTASGITYATVQFNKDGSFSSAAVYRTNSTSLLQNPGPSSANTNGNYSYTGNVFTIVPGLAGWFSFAAGSSSPPTGLSSSVQITQLTASNLIVHTENTFTLTNGTGSHTYDELNDYYYTK